MVIRTGLEQLIAQSCAETGPGGQLGSALVITGWVSISLS